MNAKFRCGCLIIILSFFTSSAYARCESPSPLLLEGKEFTEHLAPRPLNRKEFNELKRFIAHLSGRYKVTWRDEACLSADQSRTQKATGTSGIGHSSGSDLIVPLDLDTGEVALSEVLHYELREEVLMSSAANGSVHTVVEVLSAGEIEFRTKSASTTVSRRALSGVHVIHSEQVVNVQRSYARVSINIDTYTQGLLSGMKKIVMTRIK